MPVPALTPIFVLFLIDAGAGVDAAADARTDPLGVSIEEARLCPAEVGLLRAYAAEKGTHPQIKEALIDSARQQIRECVPKQRYQEAMRERFRKNHARLDAEQAQKAAVAREREERDEAHRQNAGFMRLVWSMQICIGEQNRSSALTLIAQEKKYSKITGSANLSRREQLKHDLQQADELIATSKLQLNTARLKPAACPALRRLLSCVGDESEGCQADEIQDALRLLQLPEEDG